MSFETNGSLRADFMMAREETLPTHEAGCTTATDSAGQKGADGIRIKVEKGVKVLG